MKTNFQLFVGLVVKKLRIKDKSTKYVLTLLVHHPSDCEHDPAPLRRLPHVRHDLMVRGVEHGAAINGQDFVAGKQPPVDVSGAAWHYVAYRNLERMHTIVETVEKLENKVDTLIASSKIGCISSRSTYLYST